MRPLESVSTEPASSLVGAPVEDLETPALVLDLDVATANAALMGQRIRELSAELRPHVKVHKSPQLARIQLEYGAIGVTTATVAEAEAMVAGGIDEVLIANEVVSERAIDRIVAIAREASVTLAVDDADVLERIARRAGHGGATVGVVVELDVGMDRGGVRDAASAGALARAAADLPGIRLRGLLGYEGHCASEPDPRIRERETRAAMDLLVDAAGQFERDGLPVDVVSAGATGTYDITGSIPGVTEVQAGSYLLMDSFHEPLVSGFGFALTVVATAVSVHDDVVVFDAGRKAVGGDLGTPQPPGRDGVFAFVHEEHLGFRYPGGAPFRIGDRAAIVPGYAPTAVNLFGTMHVARDGRIVDVWPVLARHGDR